MKTTAKVSMTIEVFGCGAWDGSCTVGQVREQAAKNAIGRIRQLISAEGLQIQIIDDPRVTVITFEDESDA